MPTHDLLLLSLHELITAIIKSVVTGQAPVSLEWKNTSGESRTEDKFNALIITDLCTCLTTPCWTTAMTLTCCSRGTATLDRKRVRMGLANDMVPAIRTRYEGKEVERVIGAWNDGMAGEVTRKEWEGKGTQVAASYIQDLYAEPWHDVDRYPWMATIEANASAIRDELRRVCAGEAAEKGAAWVTADGDDMEAYGPGWQKLVLQDRRWDAEACRLFPTTCKILKNCGAPCVHTFFARQRSKSGIQPHTDNSNFFVTAHFGLQIPGEDCWIKVGDEKRKWVEEKALVFDSSFVHETKNDATSDRIVLLVRFWHPQLTEVERSALDFIFDALGDPSVLNQRIEPVLDQPNEPNIDKTNDLGLEQPSEALLDQTNELILDQLEEPVLDQPMGAPVEASKSTAEVLGLESSEAVSITLDNSRPQGSTVEDRRRGSIAAEPLGAEQEAERLDGFLADLKSQGLLPGAGGKDDVLAQAPKNRGGRRKAAKARKKASRMGKNKGR